MCTHFRDVTGLNGSAGGDVVAAKSIKHWLGDEGDGPTAVQMMGRRAHSDVQGSEIYVIGTSCLLNWRAKRWEGEYKRWRIGRCVRVRAESRKRRSTECMVLGVRAQAHRHRTLKINADPESLTSPFFQTPTPPPVTSPLSASCTHTQLVGSNDTG